MKDHPAPRGESAPALPLRTCPSAPPFPRQLHLSPTVPPIIPADVALWDAWTGVPIENLNLDAFDDEGFPIRAREAR